MKRLSDRALFWLFHLAVALVVFGVLALRSLWELPQ